MLVSGYVRLLSQCHLCTAGSEVGVWLCETTATLHRAQTWIVVFSQTEGWSGSMHLALQH